MIQSEVSLLRRVKHPNIVLLIEEIDTQNDLYLVMELVKVLHQHNSLTSTLHTNKTAKFIIALFSLGKCFICSSHLQTSLSFV